MSKKCNLGIFFKEEVSIFYRKLFYKKKMFKVNKPYYIYNKSKKIFIGTEIFKKKNPMLGTYISLLKNFLIGNKLGFYNTFEIIGTGFFVKIINNISLEINLGYSKNIFLNIPKDLNIKKINSQKFEICSLNKQILGDFCSKIKRIKKFSPYKKKGIFFSNENFILKQKKKK
ncbi:hypothetical protein [Candidatus Vidania fulgoroideorum]